MDENKIAKFWKCFTEDLTTNASDIKNVIARKRIIKCILYHIEYNQVILNKFL